MKEKTDWPLLIEKWETSGLSKQAFCKQESLTYHTFLYHFNKRDQNDAGGGFQRLLFDGSAITDRIDYFYNDGRSVSFPMNTPKEIIRFILSL